MSNFNGVEDTLFIPLVGRIYSSKKFSNFFYDSKALELEKYIPSELIKENISEYFNIASVARYYEFDNLVREFIDENDECNILSLGCGLETMYFRINNPKATFYEVDMPKVIEQRKLVLGETDKDILIGSDLLDFDWINKVDTTKPTLAIVSGVFQYFHKEEVLSLINALKDKFENICIAFDATNKIGVKKAVEYVKKTGNQDAMMYFYVEKPEDFAKESNTTLIRLIPFYKHSQKILKKKLKLSTRITCYFGDKLGFTKILYLKIK